jgi:hypothetical protein
MARRKIPGFRTASVKEARELSKLPWARDEALSDRIFEARVLLDGRVLLFVCDGEKAPLYPSREALMKVVQEAEAEAAKPPLDPARDLLPPKDDFIRDVEKLASSLGKAIGVPDEVLDRSVASLDPVDKAVVKLRRAKRMTPEVFTPLTAYVGEVMRLLCDGRWGRLPATKKKSFPVYDPAEWSAFQATRPAARQAATAAGERAAADAKAKGASKDAVMIARTLAEREAMRPSDEAWPKPLRYDEYEERIAGHEHEPVLWAHDGALVQPVAAVVKTLMERSTQGSLRVAVEGRLYPYVVAKRKAASSG